MLKDFRFHHIGYAVKNIEEAVAFFREMGFSIGEVVLDTIQNTYICFAKKNGFPMVEFVAPVDDKSPINKTLLKNGNTPYHCCFEVDNLEDAIANLKSFHFIKLFNPVQATGIDNRRICYLYNKNNGLIELVEV